MTIIIIILIYVYYNAQFNCVFTGNYSCLKVDLIFTRDRAFYFTTVFIPGIILVTSSFITFWLEVTYCSLFLTLFFFHSIFSDKNSMYRIIIFMEFWAQHVWPTIQLLIKFHSIFCSFYFFFHATPVHRIWRGQWKRWPLLILLLVLQTVECRSRTSYDWYV